MGQGWLPHGHQVPSGHQTTIFTFNDMAFFIPASLLRAMPDPTGYLALFV